MRKLSKVVDAHTREGPHPGVDVVGCAQGQLTSLEQHQWPYKSRWTTKGDWKRLWFEGKKYKYVFDWIRSI